MPGSRLLFCGNALDGRSFSIHITSSNLLKVIRGTESSSLTQESVMSVAAREIHLKSRPSGLPVPENFELVERRLAAPDRRASCWSGRYSCRSTLICAAAWSIARATSRRFSSMKRSTALRSASSSNPEMQGLAGRAGQPFRRLARLRADRRCGSQQDRRQSDADADLAGPVGIPGPRRLCRAAATGCAERGRDSFRLRGQRRCRFGCRPDRQDQGLPRCRLGRLRREGPLAQGRGRRSTP